MRKLTHALAVAGIIGAVGMPMAAHADGAASTYTMTANVTLASNYVSRGMTQTWGGPALQGGFDYVNNNGWFAGTWLSNVSGEEFAGASTEHDLYGGYSYTVNPDLSLTATLYHYRYAKGNYDKVSGVNVDKKFDYNEIVPQVTWKWFTLKDWITVGGDYFGYNGQTLADGINKGSNNSQYIDLSFNYDLSNLSSALKGVTGTLHYGHQTVNNHEAYNWSDRKVALTKSFDGGWSAGLAWTKAHDPKYTNTASAAANNGSTMDLGKSTWTVSVGRVF